MDYGHQTVVDLLTRRYCFLACGLAKAAEEMEKKHEDEQKSVPDPLESVA